MSPLMLACTIFVILLAGSLVGLVLSRKLPQHHIGDKSKDVVRLVMGLVGTMSALVLGLLIAAAKTSYDTQSGDIVQLSAQVIELDRALSLYGPEAQAVRLQLREAVERGIDRTWPSERPVSERLALPTASVSADLFRSIATLDPESNLQRFAQSRALEIATSLNRTRLLMYEQSGSTISAPFLIVLVFWLLIIFTAFGLFAPFNATVFVSLLVGALSVSGALFLIFELDRPYEGLMHLQSAPLRNAVAQITR